MPKTFVIGDIHGAHKALKQCLERAGFDYQNDTLICLGDVCDGWPETKKCIDELLTIKNNIFILGNHDLWTLEWMKTGAPDGLWLTQGGLATINSYDQSVPPTHLTFLNNALPYFILNNKLFVHAGIDPSRSLQLQDTDTFLWDRTLAHKALDLYSKGVKEKLTIYNEVYIGHTPIPFSNPIQSCEIWLMDTGAGWSGVLSMMDIDSKEVFTSDPSPSLYPGIAGRIKRSIKTNIE